MSVSAHVRPPIPSADTNTSRGWGSTRPPISGSLLTVNAPVSMAASTNVAGNCPSARHDSDDDDDDDDDGDSSSPNNNSIPQPPPPNRDLIGRVETLEKQLQQLLTQVPGAGLARRVQELEDRVQQFSTPAPDNGLARRVQDLEDQLRRVLLLVPDNNLMGRVSSLEGQMRNAARSDGLSAMDAGSYTTPYLPGPRREYRINFSKRFQRTPSVVASMSMADVDKNANLRLRVQAQNVDLNGFTLLVEAWGDTRLYQCTVTWVALSR